jgi:hypothetical protein
MDRGGSIAVTVRIESGPTPIPEAEQHGDHLGAAQAGGFSLHAGINIQPGQRQKLERLCRYVSRPPVAVDRMGLRSSGQVLYTLKTPYRDGTARHTSCWNRWI